MWIYQTGGKQTWNILNWVKNIHNYHHVDRRDDIISQVSQGGVLQKVHLDKPRDNTTIDKYLPIVETDSELPERT
jgi:hypothetical protein